MTRFATNKHVLTVRNGFIKKMTDLAHYNKANNAYIYKNIQLVLSAGKSVTSGKRTANAGKRATGAKGGKTSTKCQARENVPKPR